MIRMADTGSEIRPNLLRDFNIARIFPRPQFLGFQILKRYCAAQVQNHASSAAASYHNRLLISDTNPEADLRSHANKYLAGRRLVIMRGYG